MRGRRKLTQEERIKREAKHVRRAETRMSSEEQPAPAGHPQKARKRRHHFVWRHYLDGWANSEGRVWCQHRDKHRFHAAAKDLGVRQDFYQLKEMTDRDMDVVEQIVIGRMPDLHAREVARGWIPMFREVFLLRDAAKRRGVTSAELDAELDTKISNLEEDLHTEIEHDAIPLLDGLRRGDATVLTSAEAYMHFAWFLGAQYTRTPWLLANMRQALAGLPDFNLSAAWGLMRTIFAMNIGAQIFANRTSSNLCFLDAGASSQFIAGDQPMVNLGGVERMELYYPLTPKRAVKLTMAHERPGSESKALTDAETSTHNRRIREVSTDQIYAASEEVLIQLLDDAAPH